MSAGDDSADMRVDRAADAMGERATFGEDGLAAREEGQRFRQFLDPFFNGKALTPDFARIGS